MEIDDRSNGASLRLRLGDTLHLRLNETPTTGFRWRLDRDGAPALTSSDDSFTPGAALGAAGVHMWSFLAAERGRARIELVLVRGWQAPDAAMRKFAVDVSVATEP
jgi:inhibitor of cysteine peptidase